MPESIENISVFHTIFNECSEAIVITDKYSQIILVNSAFTTITGYTLDDVQGKKPSILKSGIHKEEFYLDMWKTVKERGIWTGKIWNKRKNADIYPELLTVKALTGDDGEVINYIGMFQDIGHYVQAEQYVDFLKNYDQLTELPNRAKFISILDAELAKGSPLALLFFDINRFRNINNSFGYAFGDRVLAELAKKLKTALISIPSYIGRHGSDEFVVAYINPKNRVHITKLANTIFDIIKTPLVINGRQVNLSGSIGISCYPDDGDNIDTLLKHANTAMTLAKLDQRDSFKFYSSKMTNSIKHKFDLEESLHKALDNDEFEIYLQPKMLMNGTTIAGVEALIRWNHNNKIVTPVEFLRLAEEIGLINHIGNWVTTSITVIMHRFSKYNLPKEFSYSINLSAEQFRRSGDILSFEDFTKRINMSANMPGTLDIEITESMIMLDPEYSVELINILKSNGITISIDDFGTGYSSLAYLKQLPIDTLKIDQSFIRNLPNDKDDAAITKAIIAMAKNLELNVIAEGVETEEQRLFLECNGCDMFQGYLISKPISVKDFEEIFLKSGSFTFIHDEKFNGAGKIND